MDWSANKVYTLNYNWILVSIKPFTLPEYMITVENSLYMTGDLNIWKLDQDLNVLIEYIANNNPSYRGLCYNPTNGLIYVAPYRLNSIHVFDLNLNLKRNISISPHIHIPWSIIEYSNQLFVGTGRGIILVFQNEIF